MKLLQISDLIKFLDNTTIQNITKDQKFTNLIYLNLNKPIIDLILIATYLTKAYIKFYKLAKLNTKILYINNTHNYNNILNNHININNNPYINKKWVPGLINNWDTIKKIIPLYNWILIILKLVKTTNLKISIKYYNKLYKTFIKLNPLCKGLNKLKKIPSYIFILDPIKNIKAFKESIKSKKLIISIYNTTKILNYCTIPIIGYNTETTISLILNILNIAWLQASLI